MKTTMAFLLLIATVIIILLWEKLKDVSWLNRQLLNELPTAKPPFDVDRMYAAQLHWSNQMTIIDRREGQDNWRYKFAEKKFKQASAQLIDNMDVDMTSPESQAALEILDSLEQEEQQ